MRGFCVFFPSGPGKLVDVEETRDFRGLLAPPALLFGLLAEVCSGVGSKPTGLFWSDFPDAQPPVFIEM